jgi:hypothetical protein
VSNFWFNYWWPSIKGNGPEDMTSLLIVGILTGIFVPRVRRWWIAREQAVHAKLDHNAKMLMHVIHHSPDIPNEDHNGVSLIEPKETK